MLSMERYRKRAAGRVMSLGLHTDLPPILVAKRKGNAGSTISTLLHDRINLKNCQVLSLGDTGFPQCFRVVSRDYGKPR